MRKKLVEIAPGVFRDPDVTVISAKTGKKIRYTKGDLDVDSPSSRKEKGESTAYSGDNPSSVNEKSLAARRKKVDEP